MRGEAVQSISVKQAGSNLMNPTQNKKNTIVFVLSIVLTLTSTQIDIHCLLLRAVFSPPHFKTKLMSIF